MITGFTRQMISYVVEALIKKGHKQHARFLVKNYDRFYAMPLMHPDRPSIHGAICQALNEALNLYGIRF